MRLKYGMRVVEFTEVVLKGQTLEFYGNSAILPILKLDLGVEIEGVIKCELESVLDNLLRCGVVDVETEIIPILRGQSVL